MYLAYLMALYIICSSSHSGQWSKGYRLLCLAQYYADRIGCELWRIHEKHNEWRQVDRAARRELLAAGRRPCYSDWYKQVAYFLRKLRHHRNKL